MGKTNPTSATPSQQQLLGVAIGLIALYPIRNSALCTLDLAFRGVVYWVCMASY
jgi:hypothetical protein